MQDHSVDLLAYSVYTFCLYIPRLTLDQAHYKAYDRGQI